MKFENIKVYNFENALRGMRNPKNSWNLSDSYFGLINIDDDEHDYEGGFKPRRLLNKRITIFMS